MAIVLEPPSTHAPRMGTVGTQRAAIYYRVSSAGQEEGYSLETQLAECRTYALEHGYTVDDAHVYREVHVGYELWERPQLSKRDRSLVTVSALIAMNRPDQLRSHLVIARQNGVTEEELIETITHMAFYAGWPSAVTALQVAKEVFKK